jgi:MoxR-like ATPase
MGTNAVGNFTEEIGMIRDDIARIESEFGKKVVANKDILRSILKALFCDGHILLEGAPGLGKTLMIRTVSKILDLKFSRIQFTPDLMPADIIGTNIIVEDGYGDRQFRFEKGPVFTNILLADEINRASPKTQSALLQAMEEHEATVFGETYYLEKIFFTLATQNPIEMAGTYPLPEAQLDRFLFKLIVSYPGEEDLRKIGQMNMDDTSNTDQPATTISAERILSIREILQQIPITDRIYDFAVRLIRLTHPDTEGASDSVSRFVRYGSSPRGLNAILSASRVSAALDGRINIALEDIEENYIPALRHRLIMKFEGDIEGVSSEMVLREIFKKIRKQF